MFSRGSIIASKYRIDSKLGEGGYGKVYSATDERGRKYAIKVEKVNNGDLQREKFVYEHIARDHHGNRAIGVSRLHYFGEIGGHFIMVLDMLGTSLTDKVKRNGGKFSLKCCYMIALQALTRIEYLHNNNFLHRDIKPDNILTGRPGYCRRRLYLVDFGLAKTFRDQNGRHVKIEESKFAGTVRYASINVMMGIRASRRDDLESLGYVLAELWRGDLPWRGIPWVDEDERLRKVMKCKRETDIEELVNGFWGLEAYFGYVRRLGFADRPSYRFLRDCFLREMRESGIVDDGRFDWVDE